MLKRNVVIFLIVCISLFLIFLVLLLSGNCCFKDRCEIPIRQFGRTPIFFNFDDETFVYPQDESIVIERDKSISIGCPGSTLNTGDVWAQMTCITETTFVVFNDNVDISTLYCEDEVKSTARYTGKSCEDSGREIEVGFGLGSDKFLRQMRICFDEKEQKTLYSEHNLTSLIGNRELSSRRPYFEEGTFFNLSGNKLYELYSKKTQRRNINIQLRITDLNSTEVIKNGNSSFYLSRGHLAPKADFLYGSQQNASFYYVNAAPQWEIINGGSWNMLEWKIRLYVANRGQDLQIITGTFDKLILEKYSPNPLYLYYNPPISSGVPIPKFFWKIVYDPVIQKGVAFVGTNNPFLKKDGIYFICPDIMTSINWIKLNNKNVTTGFIYACNVDDLRKKVTYIPKLQIIGPLVE
ncbi:uncharacterized protein LOC123315667 [Coccinella septempunctata]|uniref:uncharacterized protein LOC123315667 n=1 Tax=Coccinella septempunctata TaxID=41139 RepID=UPI001D09462E|nr:uncharacterized protein LOC123315667 [Coccinella septempunctata]